MITEIKSGNKIFALLIDLSSLQEGTFPVTNPSWAIQLLLMKRKRGHIVRKHMHKKIRKSSVQPMEALVVVQGAVEVRIFDRKGTFIAKKNLTSGQCLLIVDGAHELEVKKDSLMYAFKDGPYKEDKVLL